MNSRHWVALALVLVASGPQAFAGQREELYAEMLLIAAQIDTLQVSRASVLQVEALRARYRALSERMGGDDPARAGRAVRVSPERTAARASSAPALPPVGCRARSFNVRNLSPVSIPPFGVVTSTIDVSGATGTIWDVDVQTLIAHTFPADLDVTLRSPAGTVVTLTSDNGGGSDNVFNGTRWDDSANPGGQVPYTSNAGLVTDHAYTNNVAPGTLVPEEALGAFLGENPNGTWTLTIADDLDSESGSLDDWGLFFTTVDAPPIHRPFAVVIPTSLPIPDPGVLVASFEFTPGAAATIVGVHVGAQITHSANADLDVTLTSPAGTVVTLTSDNGGDFDNVFADTGWDIHANPGGQVPYASNAGLTTDRAYANLVPTGSIVPEESLAAFQGENPTGTWTLSISDDRANNAGALALYSVVIEASDGCYFKGDQDRDGQTDLVLRDELTSQHRVWRMSGADRLEDLLVTPTPANPQRVVAVDDFDGDGRSDFVVANPTTNVTEFWMMGGANGTARLGPAQPLTGATPLPAEWILAASGDFNADFNADLLWRNRTTQKLLIWKLGEGAARTQKTGEITPVPDQAADANWRVVAALDFDNDGQRDLLWYNDTSGKTVVWFMDALVHRVSGTFTVPAQAGDANWRVVAAGDYGTDASGHRLTNDIVWRNDTTGKLVVWFMDGSRPPTRTSGRFTNPASAPDTTWLVAGPR